MQKRFQRRLENHDWYRIKTGPAAWGKKRLAKKRERDSVRLRLVDGAHHDR